jgi:hypothetical protein
MVVNVSELRLSVLIGTQNVGACCGDGAARIDAGLIQSDKFVGKHVYDVVLIAMDQLR